MDILPFPRVDVEGVSINEIHPSAVNIFFADRLTAAFGGSAAARPL